MPLIIALQRSYDAGGGVSHMESNINRRDFVKTAGLAGLATTGLATTARSAARVLGANDRINLGFIGIGGRSHDLLTQFSRIAAKDANGHITPVCDVYEKRKR